MSLQCTIHRQTATPKAWSATAANGLDCFIQGYGDTFRVILT